MKRIAFTIIALGLGAALFWFTIHGRAPAAPDGGMAASGDYITQPSATRVIRRTISATGTLKARSTVDVSSQLSGQVASVSADFNDVVVKDQVLAELDRRGYQAHVAQAEAEAAMARENVAILSARGERARRNLDEAIAKRQAFSARLDKARAASVVAASRRGRSETLQRQGAATASSFEDARAAQDTAEAGLREAGGDIAAHEQAISSLEAALHEAQAELANARAALPLRDAALDLAKLDLERSTIRSPIGGVVVKRAVEPGQTVAASLDAPVLFTIAGDLAKMEIHANVDEADVGALAPGQHAVFSAAAFPERAFDATVVKIRKAGQPVQGVVTYTVVLETENGDGRLLPGMTCTVRIVVEEMGPVLTVPLAALRFAPDGEAATGGGIWVLLRNGRIEPRSLVLGPDDQQFVSVKEGRLTEGEAVVVARSHATAANRMFGIRF